MENQVRKSLSGSFRALFHPFWRLTIKRKKFKAHQHEMKRITDQIRVIENRHPELSAYLNKIPEFRPNANDPEARLADLRKHHIHLLELLEKYELN